MSTRRERLEARLEKRRLWAESRKAKSDQAFNKAHAIVEHIPLGQPILVGHHSEKRHRAAIDRMGSHMDKGIEHAAIAKEHDSKADGIERALDASIFSDDPDAVEALKARIAELEAERESQRLLGAAWRKAKKPASTDIDGWKRVASLLGCEYESTRILRGIRNCASEEGFCNRGPVPSYVLSNLGGNISRLKKRLESVKLRQQRQERAEAAPNGVTIASNAEYSQVTFAEKPERAIIDALKAAEFYWSNGSWFGKRAKLPACVAELAS